MNSRSLAGMLLILGLGGCATQQTYVPDTASAGHIDSVEQARAILRGATGTLCFSSWVCGELQPTLSGIELTDNQTLVFLERNGDRSHTLPLQSLKLRVNIIDESGWVYFTEGSDLYLAAVPAAEAKNVADALTFIQRAPLVAQQRQAAFEAAVQSYRDAKVKPVPGEDVRRYKVQAEAAVHERRFEDAARLYDEALQIAPWWPEGHFNRALILGELHQYPSAVQEMHRYLALVPNAPDARQALDKTYVWESEPAVGSVTQ